MTRLRLLKSPSVIFTKRVLSTYRTVMAEPRTPQSCIADFCLVPVGTEEETEALHRKLMLLSLDLHHHQYQRKWLKFSVSSRKAVWSTACTRQEQQLVREYIIIALWGKVLRSIIDGLWAEGSWKEVMDLIGEAHVMLHEKGIPRIHTDIRVGSRYGSLSWDIYALLTMSTESTKNNHLRIRSMPLTNFSPRTVYSKMIGAGFNRSRNPRNRWGQRGTQLNCSSVAWELADDLSVKAMIGVQLH